MSFRQSSTVMRAMMSSREASLLQPIDQVLVALELSRRPQALRPHDAHEIGQRDVKTLVDNNIVELLDMGELLPGGAQASLDDLGSVLAAFLQPSAQRLRRRGQDENA